MGWKLNVYKNRLRGNWNWEYQQLWDQEIFLLGIMIKKSKKYLFLFDDLGFTFLRSWRKVQYPDRFFNIFPKDNQDFNQCKKGIKLI